MRDTPIGVPHLFTHMARCRPFPCALKPWHPAPDRFNVENMATAGTRQLALGGVNSLSFVCVCVCTW